jgi:hypothetical protein
VTDPRSVLASKQSEAACLYQAPINVLKGQWEEIFNKRAKEIRNISTEQLTVERPLLWFEVTIYKVSCSLWGAAGVLFRSCNCWCALAIKNQKSIILFTLILAYSVSYSLALPFFFATGIQ